MPIVCIEGASAIGKSSTCRFLELEYGFKRVPEVNELFERPLQEGSNWYLEKQLDRWVLASDASKRGEHAILDGDPFQPLWYNWIYSDAELQPLGEVIEFYEAALANGEINFPEKYFVLSTSINKLIERKECDGTRSRRNFEKHLNYIVPQLAYFSKMKQFQDNVVDILEADCVHKTAELISAESLKVLPGIDGSAMFVMLKSFLQSTHNNGFKTGR